MLLTDTTRSYFSTIQFRVRKAMAESRSSVAYAYEGEPFFAAYEGISQVWKKQKPQRDVAQCLGISRNTLTIWEQWFVTCGSVGLLPELNYVPVQPALERLVLLIKSARPHERANYALTLADALGIHDVSLELDMQLTQSYTTSWCGVIATYTTECGLLSQLHIQFSGYHPGDPPLSRVWPEDG